MILTLIPPVSSWGYEVISTPETARTIGSSLFNGIHLDPQPDLPLMPKYACDCLTQAPNQNHSSPPIYITVFTSILSWSDSTTFYEVLPVFLCTTIFNP